MRKFSVLKNFRVNANGSGGLVIGIKMAFAIAVASIPMLARSEGVALKDGSEKLIDVTRNKIELQALLRPAIGSIEQCQQILNGATDQSDQVKRVRETLKKYLHFRALGDGHMILRPGWYADYSDIVSAHSSMSEDDIPVLVSLIGRGKLKDGMRSIGFGALGMFGEKALPCIDAGMAIYPKYASDLYAVKGNIEVNHRYLDPSRRGSSQKNDRQYLETQKGGKQ
jgi:hypothetical protein